MRYVVTGAAGFIGSHLAEALQAAGHEVVGIDSFTDYYDPALKERNARAPRRAPPRPRPRRARLRRLRRCLPPRRPAGRPQLRRRLPALRRAERAREPARLRGGGGGRRARRLLLLLLDLRRGRALSDGRGRAAAAGLAVRDHEARLRAPGAGVHDQLRARRRRAPLLQRLRAAAAPGHGVPADPRRARLRRAVRALRRRRAEPQLHLRGRRRRGVASSRWSARRPARPTTSAAARRRR